MKRLAAGVDLGGTKIRAGIVDSDGNVRGEAVTTPTGAGEPPAVIVGNILRAIDAATESAGVSRGDLVGVGIGSPGPLDLDAGVVLEPRNLPTLHHFPLRRELAAAADLPVELNNDANVFVLGEACGGAGRGHSIVFGVTLGTGFGAGLVLDRRVFSGATGTAAEVWCFRYGDGIIEDYVSGRGLKRIYTEITGDFLRPREIAAAAAGGNPAACEAFRQFGNHLGIALSYIVNVLDPGVVVVGGSVARDWAYFRDGLEETLRPNINSLPRERLRVLPAALGDLAPVVGAAGLVLAG